MGKSSLAKYKAQIAFVLIILVVLGIPTLLFYRNTKKTIIYDAGERAKNVAITVSILLEQEIDQYRRLSDIKEYETGAYDQQYYNKMLGVFQTIRAETGADYVFTEKLVSDENIAYILDGEPPDSENFSSIGTLDSISEPELEAFKKGIPTATDLIKDPVWGYYVTGFAPIIEPSSNRVVGLVGIDYSAQEIANHLNYISMVLISILSFFFIVLSVLAILITDKIQKNLNLDFMTGLYNRRIFERMLSRIIKASKAENLAFTLMFIDVDNFKAINDQFGHDIGDIALQRIAFLIKTHIKKTDYAFRYGGDEFAAILTSATREQAGLIAKRLSDRVKINPIHVNDDQSIKLSISIGLAEYHAGLDRDQLIQEAEKDMYLNKSSHKSAADPAAKNWAKYKC